MLAGSTVRSICFVGGGLVAACGGQASPGPSDLEQCVGSGPARWEPLPEPEPRSSRRNDHTAAWTGTELIVWGGVHDATAPHGFRFAPATGVYSEMSTVGAPSARGEVDWAWTGTELIVWGGVGKVDSIHGVFHADGARYNPARDEWQPMSTVNAPEARTGEVFAWTGSELLVWGGERPDRAGQLATGARYRPDTDEWRAMATEAAPAARSGARAAWTGDELLVWGGVVYYPTDYDDTNTGALYHPATDTWRATSTDGAPAARPARALVWAGGSAILWGGEPLVMRYDPSSDRWDSASVAAAPPEDWHAVSTGPRMLVFGTGLDQVSYGGVYDPTADAWTAVPTECAPVMWQQTLTWIGSGAVVWGTSIEKPGEHPPWPEGSVRERGFLLSMEP